MPIIVLPVIPLLPFLPGRCDRLWAGRPDMNTRVNMTMITTLLEMPGYRGVRNLGMVRGIVVRSRSIFGTLGASLQTIVGGNISLFTSMCEKTREDALELMMQHAAEHGANAVLGVRYDANEVMQGVTEVLAYGSAVVVEPNV